VQNRFPDASVHRHFPVALNVCPAKESRYSLFAHTMTFWLWAEIKGRDGCYTIPPSGFGLTGLK